MYSYFSNGMPHNSGVLFIVTPVFITIFTFRSYLSEYHCVSTLYLDNNLDLYIDKIKVDKTQIIRNYMEVRGTKGLTSLNYYILEFRNLPPDVLKKTKGHAVVYRQEDSLLTIFRESTTQKKLQEAGVNVIIGN
jgi:hypothetical protein